MKFNWTWIKRRWYEFRQGHNIYLSFVPSFVNFILLTFNFLILSYSIDFFKNNIVFYGLLVVAVYAPTAILIGHFHIKRQLQTDLAVSSSQNPYWIEAIARLERIEKLLEKLGCED